MSSQNTGPQPPPGASIYEQFGGEPAFIALVDSFYRRVAEDEQLRSMFPADLAPARRKLALFLIQFFGGPNRYSQERGHPRLRLRHAPFPITVAAAERWLAHMLAALEEQIGPSSSGPRALAALQIRQYFLRATPHLVNRAPAIDESISG